MLRRLLIYFFLYTSSVWAEPKTELLFFSVDKTTLRGSLRTLPEDAQDSKEIHSFPLAIGREHGDKHREGDLRTPEGIYFVSRHITEDALRRDKYGRHAIALDYPNALDIRLEKSGSGVWVHGAGDDSRMAEKYTTEGCVALFNADILRIRPWLPTAQSLVVISNDASRVNQSEDLEEVATRTLSWLRAWRARDVKGYASHYSETFQANGRNLKQFRDYKARIFRAYRDMSIELDTVRHVTHSKYAVTVMNQHFVGDRHYDSYGRKVLYWVRYRGAYHIAAEVFSDQPIKGTRYSSEDVLALAQGSVRKGDPRL